MFVHAWVLARNHREWALGYFLEALRSDIADIQGGTTAEGVHLAAMAGSVDIPQRCFAGVVTRDGALWLDPYWPPAQGTFDFDIRLHPGETVEFPGPGGLTALARHYHRTPGLPTILSAAKRAGPTPNGEGPPAPAGDPDGVDPDGRPAPASNDAVTSSPLPLRAPRGAPPLGRVSKQLALAAALDDRADREQRDDGDDLAAEDDAIDVDRRAPPNRSVLDDERADRAG